jgi:hypothetical protein
MLAQVPAGWSTGGGGAGDFSCRRPKGLRSAGLRRPEV